MYVKRCSLSLCVVCSRNAQETFKIWPKIFQICQGEAIAGDDEEGIAETGTHTFTKNLVVYLDDSDDDENPLTSRRVWGEEERERRQESGKRVHSLTSVPQPLSSTYSTAFPPCCYPPALLL